MEALKRAAERMLQALGEQPEPQPQAEAAIERMSVDVRVGDQTEVVVLRLRSGQLQTSCTCGVPRCPHAQHALRLLVAPQSVTLASELTRRSSPRLERVVIERASPVNSMEPRPLNLNLEGRERSGSSGSIALDLRQERFS
ncbi:MAG TPA: hypothetical protein VJV78_09730, partial [Polyangiales bacterium]|nr:hypothetical protein [Polyangiales bacterium]